LTYCWNIENSVFCKIIDKSKNDGLIRDSQKIKDLELELQNLRNKYNALKKQKKFGLVWEDKPEDVVVQCEKQLPVLKEVENKAIAENTDPQAPTHILIEGDNYHALSVLNYTHKGKIDVIYIDPPYNTGAKDWKYNNDYVDGEDSFRHSKWLSMMKKRLRLAKNLLTDIGIICVTIDDYECPNLWLLMNEIFGEENNLGVVTIRNNPGGRKAKRKIAQVHEYAIFYGNTEKAVMKKLPIMAKDKSHNYLKDDKGYFEKRNLRKDGVDSEAIKPNGTTRERYFPIYYDPDTKKISATEKLQIEILPIDSSGNRRIWRRNQKDVNKLYEAGDLFCTKIKGEYQIHFKFRGGLDGEMPKSIWYDPKFSASEYGTTLINEILGREKFQYPKSLPAVVYALKCCSNLNDITILDFFAGSGTTGHAVLELNKEDGGTRQFILCTNNENKICEEVTYPRIKKVINGYGNTEGIPANLRYFKTDFIEKSEDTDENRVKLTERCYELLQIKEDCYDSVNTKVKNMKFWKNSNKLLAVIFDRYDTENDIKYINEIKRLSTDTKHKIAIYRFSIDGNLDMDISSLPNAKLEEIPEEILKVYNQIFKKRRK